MSQITKGATDVTRYIVLVNATTGQPEAGLAMTDLDLTYVRNRAAASKTDATALLTVASVHGDNKAIEVDATNCPGLYRIDWPDAAFASGVDKVLLAVNCSGCHPAVEQIDLVDFAPGQVDLTQSNASNNNTDQLGGQWRRTHAVAGGTISSRDHSAANPTWTHRNEADDADLITRTRTVTGDVETITPS